MLEYIGKIACMERMLVTEQGEIPL
jgi:hypothetical protein